MKRTTLALALVLALPLTACGNKDREVLQDKYKGQGDCEKDWGRGKCNSSGGGGFFMSPYYYSGFRSDTALSATDRSVGSTTPIRSSLAPSGAPVAPPKSGFTGSSSSVKTGGFGKTGGSFSSFGG